MHEHLLNIDSLNHTFETRDPKAILRWSIDTFGAQLAIVTSFQPTGIVALHMLNELGAHPDVLTLDTGLLFQETYALMDEISRRFDLTLKRITPPEAPSPGMLPPWQTDPDLCCYQRKVEPLQDALMPYAAWIAGLRRDQTGRSGTPIVMIKNDRVKIHPFANWTQNMAWAYIHAHKLPYNPLHDQGYPSIGCWPCTRAVLDGEDTRAGRWSTSSKTECGLHT